MACISKRRNRYVIDFYDTQGKRRWITLPKGSTKTAAKDKLREVEDQLKKGIYLPAKKIPVFSEIAKDWLNYKKPNLRETTWEVYQGHLKNHFDDLNNLKINSISTAKIEKFISSRHDDGMNIGTLRKILVTRGQIMGYAVRHKYIDYNPVREAEKPRQQRKQETGIRILTPTEIPGFLQKAENQKYRTLFLTGIMTGAREGEILGSKWSDLDMVNSQLHIQRTFNKGRFFATKTAESNRHVDIGPMLMTELKRWKLACPKSDLDLIFPNESGKPINYSNMVRRHFLPALKDAGLPRIRFHDLRHTNASIRIEEGENIKYIQTQLGHSSPMVTLNIYAHLIKSKNPEAACRLENAIFEQSGSKMVAETKIELKKGLRFSS